MTIGRHLITLEATGADGATVVVDQEHFLLSGHQATFQPTDTIGDNTYRWAMEGGRLLLTFVSTSVTKGRHEPLRRLPTGPVRSVGLEQGGSRPQAHECSGSQGPG